MPRNAPAFWTSEVIPLQNVSLPATSWATQTLGLEMLDEHAADQVEAEKADAPEPDHARERQQHADDRVLAPARVAEELGERAQLVLAARRRSRLPAPPPSSARAP